MRLGNGAINDAGQGHNGSVPGVDRTQWVCIPLCQKEFRASGAARAISPTRHGGCAADYYAPYYYSPSWSEPVDMEDNP